MLDVDIAKSRVKGKVDIRKVGKRKEAGDGGGRVQNLEQLKHCGI